MGNTLVRGEGSRVARHSEEPLIPLQRKVTQVLPGTPGTIFFFGV